MPLTLRQLLIYHDAQLVSAWDETASLYSAMHNILVFLSQYLDKRSTMKYLTAQECHPLRSAHKRKGLRITPDNFGALKSIVGAIGKKGSAR